MKKYFLFFSFLVITSYLRAADMNCEIIKSLVATDKISTLKDFLKGKAVSNDILVRNMSATKLLTEVCSLEMMESLIELRFIQLSSLDDVYIDHLKQMVEKKAPNAYARAIQALGISGFFALKGIWNSNTDTENQNAHESSLKKYGIIDQTALDNRDKIKKHTSWNWLFCHAHVGIENTIREEIGLPSVHMTYQSGRWVIEHSKGLIKK